MISQLILDVLAKLPEELQAKIIVCPAENQKPLATVVFNPAILDSKMVQSAEVSYDSKHKHEDDLVEQKATFVSPLAD